MAKSVALFTHYWAVQLSAMPNSIILNRRTQAGIKNCKFFWPEQGKITFLRSSPVCKREYLGRAYIVCSSSVFKALLLSV